MYALNIDPRNPHGNPGSAELRRLGVEMVRFTFKDATAGVQPNRDTVRFYRRQVKVLAEAGIRSLVLLSHETTLAMLPTSSETGWDSFIVDFSERAVEIAKTLARWQPAFQIWQAPDQPSSRTGFDSMLSEAMFGRLLSHTHAALKGVDTRLKVVTGGLVSGQPSWLARVRQSLGGRLPADALAIHPYTKRPDRDWPTSTWGTGYIGDLIADYRQVVDLPIWLTEVGVDTQDVQLQAEYLQRLYQAVTTDLAEPVARVFWFCYADGMAHPFGLVDQWGQPKPAYEAFRSVALSADIPVVRATTGLPISAASVSLDRLHTLAAYLEQFLIFGQRDWARHRQLELELRANPQRLSRVDIWHLMQRMLAGSTHTIEQPEIEAIDALRTQKDLYGLVRSIVMASHQKTGALSGRLGVHVRISAETDANAITNIEAVMQVLRQIKSGNRMIIMDSVKATADTAKLQAPDVFETNIYGQHRNGLIENHAWNLQRLVRAIRDQGLQDRVTLLLRLDGPDGGANVNIFSGTSLQKYELAISKIIRYLEAMLPDVLFKIVLGNEPDLPHERLWSDPHANPRDFTLNQFAPAMGNFLKKLARQRPDVTFICPALSANLKNDQLAYYTALFGKERPDNLIPALHGYSIDVAALPAGQRNLLEQQAEILRVRGGFWRVSGTEIGSSKPFGDGESLSDKGRFDDVALWLLLSTEHRAPPGQDNNWSFRINPRSDDPSAYQLAHVINRSAARVFRNIRERSGTNLQILRGHAGQRPAYAVEYVSHNTPTPLNAGQTTTVTLTIRNTGSLTWPAGGPHPVRLGYHWYSPDGAEVDGSLWPDFRTQLPRDLPPEASVTLSAKLGAPSSPGAYELRWDMVEELKTWFAWQGVPTLNVRIRVDTVAAESPTEPGGLRVSASHNNQQQGADNLMQAIDNDPNTRWSSRLPQQPGMWFRIDLGAVRPVSRIQLRTDRSPMDYPRGYVVTVSSDGQNWNVVAENRSNDRLFDVTLSPRPARFIRVEQTGSDPVYWWSIHEIVIESASATSPSLSLSASHNNAHHGPDNLSQVVDGRPDTRWSSRVVQQPGMWFEIDLNQTRTVRGLTLDTAGSPNDYPRGFVVRLSTDRNHWDEVARNDHNDRPLDVTFSPRPARFIRIEQTGRSDRWWWSIHEVTVKS